MEEYRKEELELKAKLAQKKNAVRKTLNEKGVLKRLGSNTFDHYTYFSEAQYKELFTELFAHNGIEVIPDTVKVEAFEGTPKQPIGRRVTVKYTLTDIDTGYEEVSHFVGEGIDKGDKAIYKAYTGSLKYFLSITFMVATGDDPEKYDKTAEKKVDRATAKKLQDMIESYGLDVKKVCAEYEHERTAQFTENEYVNCLKRLEATKKAQEERA